MLRKEKKGKKKCEPISDDVLDAAVVFSSLSWVKQAS